MKKLLFLFFFLFLESISFSATLPLKEQILFENISIEKDSIAPKEHIDISKHIMQWALIVGGILLGWGAIQSTEPCPSNGFVSLCFNGLAQIAIGTVLVLVGILIFLGRKTSDTSHEKQAMKNKTK